MTQMIPNIIAHATIGVAMKNEGERLDTNLHLSILQFKDLNLVQYHDIGSLINFIIYSPNLEMAIVLNKIILGDGMIVTFIIIFHVLNTT
jgi:hypothetical protein